ncbi:MAG TPA: DUF2971 domain-containing protein [Thermoanaerobaculia bacterium]|nr:DUF2971 domain-containing protein [Thermoanaerobaculia bacterium]
MILYKYLPPERMDVLQGCLIAFTPPCLFNDPFEAEPVFPSDAPEAIALFEETRIGRARLAEGEESALQARIGAMQNAHGLSRIVLEQAVRSVGVLSLSEKRDCPLMWAHYTAQHTGFVIGFDMAHPAWVASGRLNGPPGEPRKMMYSTDRPSPAAMNDVAPEHIWYTKSSEWAYEHEWRVTRWTSRAVKLVKSATGDEIPLHEFPPEAVRDVILGQSADELLEFMTLDLITKPPYENVTVRRVELDSSRFRFNIVPG